MVGNISSGPLGAHLGRRELVIASYTGIFIFSILSSTSASIAVLLIWRFIVGWSIGIGQPAWMAIAAEITPSSWRVVTAGFSQTMFAFGELYAAFLLMNDDPSLKHLNWRRVIQLGAIPSLILMALAIPFLQQSPTYLQLKGCHAEAIKVLESMRRDNRASDVSVDFRLPPNPTPASSSEGMLDLLWKQGKTILGAKLILPTMVVSFTCFELNLLYYGCIYAFPQVLSDLVAEGAAQQLLVGALWEIPGVCIGIALGIMYLRKTGIKFYLTLAASVTLLFIIGGNNRNRHWAFDIALYAGYYGIKLSPNIGFVLVYQVANEIYPAEARTLGCGLCLACGRLAAMLGPLLFEGLFELTGTWLTFFLIMAGFAVFNLYVVDVIPETANKILDDHRKPSKNKACSIVIGSASALHGRCQKLQPAWQNKPLCGGLISATWTFLKNTSSAQHVLQMAQMAKLELQEARRKTVALELPSRWFDGQVPRQVNNIGPEFCWHQFALLFGKVSTIELVRPNASVLVQLLVSYKDPEGAAALMEALTDRYLLYTKSGVPDDCYPVTLTPGDGYSLREYYCSASVPSLPPREEVRHEPPAVSGQVNAAQDGPGCTSPADTRQVAEATGPPAAYVLRRCGKGPVPDALREPPETFSISAQKSRLVFGREDTCDAVLRHQYVSKVHGTFVLQDSPEVSMGRMLLLLDSSSNGVWVNGVRMATGRFQQLHPGDRISFLAPIAKLDEDPATWEVCILAVDKEAGHPAAPEQRQLISQAAPASQQANK
ncbi:slc22a15b [Symbiodinium sp. CCMP2592]|nr:slc22a15b [Symbiodinium sp. CCMP2592]